MVVVRGEVGRKVFCGASQGAKFLQHRGARRFVPAQPLAQLLLLIRWQFFNRGFDFGNRAHAGEDSKQSHSSQAAPDWINVYGKAAAVILDLLQIHTKFFERR